MILFIDYNQFINNYLPIQPLYVSINIRCKKHTISKHYTDIYLRNKYRIYIGIQFKVDIE